MIIALEGIEGSGKTTALEMLRKKFYIKVFSDEVRHGLLGNLIRRDKFVAGNQCNLDLTSFSHDLNFFADRWVLSSYVYDTIGGVEKHRYEEIFKLCVKARGLIILLDIEHYIAMNRIIKRDGSPRHTLEQMRVIRATFFQAVKLWKRLGGNIIILDTYDKNFNDILIYVVKKELLKLR